MKFGHTILVKFKITISRRRFSPGTFFETFFMDHKLAKKRKDVLATVNDQLLHVTALATRKNGNQSFALKEVSTKT